MFIFAMAVIVILILMSVILTTFILVVLRLDEWKDIKKQFSDGDNFFGTLKQFYLDNRGFNYRLYIVMASFAFYGLLDYWDQWSRISSKLAGLGFLNEPEGLVLYLTLLAIVIYTLETYRLRDVTYDSVKVAEKANELRLRPYLSLHWDSTFKGRGRRGEQITDTCLLARNDGAGIMRRVSYSVEVNGQEVLVRVHNVITPGKSGTAVVYSSNNSHQLLGDRNDQSKVSSNKELIDEGIRTARIFGEYEDLNRTKYEYSFVKDSNEQSWFREEFQRRKDSSCG